MFIFLRLLLAHFVGDFPLQFAEIYKLRYKGIRGTIPHVLIITGCLILCSWPYLHLPGIWAFIGLVSITHLLQDWVKIARTKDQKEGFWPYLSDQLLHIAIIATVFFTGLKGLKPVEGIASPLLSFYNNDKIIIYLTLLIAGSYSGTYLIETFKASFLKNKHRYTPFEKWYGIFERAVTVLIFLPAKTAIAFLLIIPFIFCLRLPIYKAALKYKVSISQEFISFFEVAFSGAIVLAVGITLYLIP
ncbi:DUF3307 domain-containing protein [Candidatus Omnitrophota bacterium]